jgi:hypothetical protein
MTDAELMDAISEGLTSTEIGLKFGISRQTVNRRRKLIRFQATAAATVNKPEADRLVSSELDALSILGVCMQRLNMLSAAYHEWLLHPADPGKYFIGPRAGEIEVFYLEPGDQEPSKATLQQLLHRVKTDRQRALLQELLRSLDDEVVLVPLQELLRRLEARYDVRTVERRAADPRVELRNTVSTISATISQAVELAAMLADVKAMADFRDTLLGVLQEVDPDVAAKITRALRSRLILSGPVAGVGGGVSAAAGGNAQPLLTLPD